MGGKVGILFFYLSSLVSQPQTPYETEPIIQAQIIYDTILTTEVAPILGSAEQLESVALLDSTVVTLSDRLYALPLDWDLVDSDKWTSPHHDYPALDVKVPVGTAVYAVREGKVTQTAGSSGACGGTIMFTTDIGDLIYCHLSQVLVKAGQWVDTGQLVGYTGGRPGAYGAGSSTVAHLHVGLTRNGRVICIQPFLASLADGGEPDFTVTTRCSN